MAETSKGKPSPVSAPAAADDSNEAFLARWTRLKKEAREQHAEKPQPKPEAVDPEAPAPELPPLDELSFDSDYRAFFHPKVNEDMRRAALKKLFSDPRFNVMDGLDVYIDDYTQADPIPPEMLAGLKHAQKILRWAEGKEEESDGADVSTPAQADPPALSATSPNAASVPSMPASPTEPLPAHDHKGGNPV